MKIFSPYSLNQIFKLLALISILWIVFTTKNIWVSIVAIAIIGTVIASEGFILFLFRILFKQPTDENIVKLFIVFVFKDKVQADKILDGYQKGEKSK